MLGFALLDSGRRRGRSLRTEAFMSQVVQCEALMRSRSRDLALGSSLTGDRKPAFNCEKVLPVRRRQPWQLALEQKDTLPKQSQSWQLAMDHEERKTSSELHATYEVGTSLGKGGYGEVFQARHRRTGVMRAVKCGSALDKRFAQTFLGEVRALGALDHQHIVGLVDHFQEEEQLYIVEELCGGLNLLDYLCQRPERVNGKPYVPERAASAIVRQCLSALGHCHARGLVHRDVKPENFMISEDSTVKLIDFGLAVPAAGASDASADELRPPGTVRYMAPEALQWGEPTAAMDTWSLGVSLFVLLTGELLVATQEYEKARECLQDADYVRQRMQESDTIAALKLSDAAVDLLLRMLQHDPKERITVCDALSHPFILGLAAGHVE